ncbi:MAG: thioredoxin family protein [Chlamydiae bacterium]|nr:thioredoxin family protein [Chlamydiota bacterium]MBI3277620.1 thioredoxin family protein [Chlamydiota bacterium]
MALTPSRMIPLGVEAPDFSLTEVASGKIISLKNFEEKKALLVMFICNHCPYVQHVKYELAKLGQDYAKKNIGIVAISSNDALKYPDDGPGYLKKMAMDLKFSFPFCYDETQEVARGYSAACTPDFFLFDAERKLVYRGQLDDSRPENGQPINGHDLRAAMDSVLAGKPVSSIQKPSMGCNIKWKMAAYAKSEIKN